MWERYRLVDNRCRFYCIMGHRIVGTRSWAPCPRCDTWWLDDIEVTTGVASRTRLIGGRVAWKIQPTTTSRISTTPLAISGSGIGVNHSPAQPAPFIFCLLSYYVSSRKLAGKEKSSGVNHLSLASATTRQLRSLATINNDRRSVDPRSVGGDRGNCKVTAPRAQMFFSINKVTRLTKLCCAFALMSAKRSLFKQVARRWCIRGVGKFCEKRLGRKCWSIAGRHWNIPRSFSKVSSRSIIYPCFYL